MIGGLPEDAYVASVESVDCGIGSVGGVLLQDRGRIALCWGYRRRVGLCGLVVLDHWAFAGDVVVSVERIEPHKHNVGSTIVEALVELAIPTGWCLAFIKGYARSRDKAHH